MTKMQSNLLVLLLAIGVGLLGYLAWGGTAFSSNEPGSTQTASASDDPREAVLLNAPQKQFALGQMRGFLKAFEGLDAAELDGKLGIMAALAAEQGPGQKRAHPAGFHEQLPATFREMSRSMRQSFAAMEASLNAGDLPGYRAKRLEALRTCNTCHESYRFEDQGYIGDKGSN